MLGHSIPKTLMVLQIFLLVIAWRHLITISLLSTGSANWRYQFGRNGDVSSSRIFLDTWMGNLTHWGRVTHICVGNITIIVSDNGLSPNGRQTITWTNDGILLIGPLGTNFSKILIKIHTFSLKKMHLKTSSARRRPFCLGLNVLRIALKA